MNRRFDLLHNGETVGELSLSPGLGINFCQIQIASTGRVVMPLMHRHDASVFIQTYNEMAQAKDAAQAADLPANGQIELGSDFEQLRNLGFGVNVGRA